MGHEQLQRPLEGRSQALFRCREAQVKGASMKGSLRSNSPPLETFSIMDNS